MSAAPAAPGSWRDDLERWLIWAAAVLGPVLVTALLVNLGGRQQRDYIFVYLGLVAAVGVRRGIWPALAAAAISFLLVDYFFVPPVGTLTIGDEQDIVNLLAFMVTAGLVGLLASRRRRALLELESVTRRLRELNAELVRLNTEQATAAQAAVRLARSEQQIRSLQETDRLRRELLANVSHELRTPLGTILTESTDSSGTRLGAEAKRRLATIAVEARRLNVLVDDMLDMARIEGGVLELDLEPLLVEDAITAAADRLHRSSPGRALRWDHEGSAVEVLADWDRLGQILDNLFSNADRFGPTGTPIVVGVAREQPGLVTVRVRDQGPGIPPELRDHVFDRFVRGEEAVGSGQASGTGLGLAIVKGLVEAHAGSVALEEADEKGTVVSFTLPEAPAS